MAQKVNTYTINNPIVIFAYFCIIKTSFSVDILFLLWYHSQRLGDDINERMHT